MISTLKDLAVKITSNPNRKDELLDSYETDSKEIRDFLNSLKNVVVYVVPALLEAFSVKHRDEYAPKFLSDLMSSDSWIGTLFNDENDDLWQYLGKNENGDPICRMDKFNVVHTMPVDFKIRWLF